jgi:UDPglucose--hexose-1-phosphate uridylyltransferase
MDQAAIKSVVDLWQKEFVELSKVDWIKYIQIFENKGAIMGCSNPHPRTDAIHHLPVEIQKECVQQQQYFNKISSVQSCQTMYKAELRKEERIIDENDSFVSLVPFWAAALRNDDCQQTIYPKHCRI